MPPEQTLINVGQPDQRQLIERVAAYAPMGYAAGRRCRHRVRACAFVAARRRWTVLAGVGLGALAAGRRLEAGPSMPRAMPCWQQQAATRWRTCSRDEFVAAAASQLRGLDPGQPPWLAGVLLVAGCSLAGVASPGQRHRATPVAWRHDLHRCFPFDANRPAQAALAGGSPGGSPRRRAQEGPARGPARLLRRRGPGCHRGGKGAGALRPARLRPQADRAQRPRGQLPRGEGRHLRRRDRRGPRRRPGDLLRPRRLARRRPVRRGPRPAHHRRHLPAGDQGAQRSRPVRQGRLRHPADRPRRPRGSRRNRRRSPRTHPDHQRPARGGQGHRPGPGEGHLALPDHPQRGRNHGNRPAAEGAVPHPAGSAQRRHLLRHHQPPGGHQEDLAAGRPGDRGGVRQLLELGPPGGGGAGVRRQGLLPRGLRQRGGRGLVRGRRHRGRDLGGLRSRKSWSRTSCACWPTTATARWRKSSPPRRTSCSRCPRNSGPR